MKTSIKIFISLFLAFFIVNVSASDSLFLHIRGLSSPSVFALDDIDSITFAGIPQGSISGTIIDAVNNSPISGAVVSVFKGSDFEANATTDTSGGYSISASPDSGYKITISKTGYQSAIYNNVTVRVNEITYLQTVMFISNTYTGVGTVSGTINNAVTGANVSGLTVKFRAAINSFTGSVVETDTTDASGLYNAKIPAGYYTAEMSGAGYITSYFTVVSIGGTNKPNQNATINPSGMTGNWRIVLTWGAEPSDLDAHLTLPDATGSSRLHCYFYDEVVDGANLDVDDLFSYGPETITITTNRNGLYRYSVRDYTNGYETASTALSSSGAKVELYHGSSLVRTYYVPGGAGNLWTVFEITNGAIVPVNTMSDVSTSTGVAKAVVGRLPSTDAYLIRNLPKKK